MPKNFLSTGSGEQKEPSAVQYDQCAVHFANKIACVCSPFDAIILTFLKMDVARVPSNHTVLQTVDMRMLLGSMTLYSFSEYILFLKLLIFQNLGYHLDSQVELTIVSGKLCYF